VARLRRIESLEEHRKARERKHRAECAPGQTRAAEDHGRHLILCTRNRTDPISGFANNGDAPDDIAIALIVPREYEVADQLMPAG